jgi:hypothetical protein
MPGNPQPTRLTRAKSAPVQARIVRCQAVNCGFAAPHARATNRLNPAQRCGKRLRKAKNPGAGKGMRLSGRLDFKTSAFHRSATLPGADSKEG